MGLSRGPVQQRTEGNVTPVQSDVIAARKVPNPELHYERETLSNDEELLEHDQFFEVTEPKTLRLLRHIDAEESYAISA